MSKSEGAKRASLIREPCAVCGSLIRPSTLARHERRHVLPWHQVDKSGDCWIWTGPVSEYGYGVARHHDEQYAHRLFYRAAGNRIPDGYEVDHLCKVRTCVNPSHLEAVTPAENRRRAGVGPREWLRKSHCSRGHALIDGNLLRRPSRPESRECLTCHRMLTSTYRARKQAAA